MTAQIQSNIKYQLMRRFFFQHVCYAMRHFISDDKFWKPQTPASSVSNPRGSWLNHRAYATLTCLVSNSFLSPIREPGTRRFSRSSNSPSQTGSGTTQSPSMLIAYPPLPLVRTDVHLTDCTVFWGGCNEESWDGYKMFMVMVPLVFFLCHCHTVDSSGGQDVLISSFSHGKVTEGLIHRNLLQRVELRSYFNKRGCKLMEKWWEWKKKKNTEGRSNETSDAKLFSFFTL